MEDDIPPSSFLHYYARNIGSPSADLASSEVFFDGEKLMSTKEAFARIQRQLALKKEKFLPENFEALCKEVVKAKKSEKAAAAMAALTRQALEADPNAGPLGLPVSVGAEENAAYDDSIEVTMESLVNELGFPNFDDCEILESELEIPSNSFRDLLDIFNAANSKAVKSRTVIEGEPFEEFPKCTSHEAKAAANNEERGEEDLKFSASADYTYIKVPSPTDQDIIIVVDSL